MDYRASSRPGAAGADKGQRRPERKSGIMAVYPAVGALASAALIVAGIHFTGFQSFQSGSPPSDERSTTIALVGDILPTHSTDSLSGVSPILREAGVAFGNLECPLSKRGRPAPLKFRNGRLMFREFIFGAEPSRAAMLAEAGLDVVSLANNHAMDYGASALADTFDALQASGIRWAGAGGNLTEARAPAVITREGVKIAFLAYVAVSTLPGDAGFAAGADSSGLAFVYHAEGGEPSVWTKERLKRDLAGARRLADVVVVSYHWGRELRQRPTAFQQKLGRLTIHYGADMVVGHHPHVLQGVEMHRGKPILYSLGNFVFRSGAPATKRSAIAHAAVGRNGISELWFQPVWLIKDVPRVPGMANQRETLRRLVSLSRELGTEMTIARKEGVLAALVTATDAGSITARRG